MGNPVRWGIVGPGKIAHLFAQDLLLVDEAALQAVASRNSERASTFAGTYNIPNIYSSYDDIFRDPDVDIVYVATPHATHAEVSIRAMEHGKAVLCEKPVGLNAKEAKCMADASKKNNVFFMEAFWTRFNPALRELLDRVERGDIGAIQYVQADFSFRIDAEPDDRMLDLKMGGGSLLELGVYPIFLAYVTLGIPERIQASSVFHESGADLQTAMIFDYGSPQALLYSSYASQSNMIATVSGTEGRLVLNPIWHETNSISFFRNYDPSEDKKVFNLIGKGFSYEVEECHRCLGAGLLESPYWSHTNSIELMGIVDSVRACTGLMFPGE